MSASVTRLRPPKPCPICDKPSAQKYHPFCSARCADIDLGRWLKGSYVIAGKESAQAAETDVSDGDGEDEN
ncbi:DNA gyrase inhibitor YacG [Pelagibacterium sediminicola]|uniref:DNA gyrase inhibitor YacG n=1 Tax=Pelagibacterium sediminicola TaxID=2248761 RepID=UPI000E313AF5|nr:DNA gyrase inhibitor YacG [Pelagibacterium sediminicola]